MPDCQLHFEGAPKHEGHEFCADAHCNGKARYCTSYTAASLTSPHACRCSIPAHGYYCRAHQRPHAATHLAQDNSRPQVFPDCGGSEAERALIQITGLQGLNFASEGDDVDARLVRELTDGPNDFLNFSDPGTVLLRDTLNKLERDPDRVVDPADISQELDVRGESSVPYIQFNADFWRGGSRDVLAAQAIHHLVIANARGYQVQAPMPWRMSASGKVELLSEASLRKFIDFVFAVTLNRAEEIARSEDLAWEDRNRLFDLVDTQIGAEPAFVWLRRVTGEPLRNPLDLVTQLILDWQPAPIPELA